MSAASPTPAASVDHHSSGTATPAAAPERDQLAEKEKVQDHSDGEASPKDVEEPQPEYPQGPQLLTIVIGMMLSFFLISLDQTIVGTAIPKITDEFHGLSQVSWYGSAYFITFGGFQSSWGKILRYFPLKASFLVAVLVFGLGSLICGVAPNATALIVGRAIQGFGGAGIGTGCYTIIAFIAPPEVRPKFTSLLGVSYCIGAVAGPLIGGAFSDRVTWRWCFYINLPVAGVASALTLFFFRTPAAAKPVPASAKEKLLQMDLVGALLAMGALVSFILAFEYGGQTEPWNSSTVIGLIVGFVLIVAAFTIWEAFQGERAMVVPRLVKQRSVWASSLFQFFFAGAYFVVIYYLPIYFQSVDGTSPIESGVRNIPLILTVSLATIVGGGIMTKSGLTTPLMTIGSALATIAAGLLYTLDLDTSTGKWIGYQILGGAGWGVAFQVTMIICQGNAKPEDISSVTAILFFFQTIGGAFSLSAAQSAFVNKVLTTLASTSPSIDQAKVIATGATEIRSAFPASQVPSIVAAYMAGVKDVFAIVIALVGFAFLTSFLSSWKRLGAPAAPPADVKEDPEANVTD